MGKKKKKKYWGDAEWPEIEVSVKQEQKIKRKKEVMVDAQDRWANWILRNGT